MLPSEALVDGDGSSARDHDQRERTPTDGHPSSGLWLTMPGSDDATPTPEIRIDRAARRAYAGDQEIPLTTQLFDLLSFFLDHRGAAVSFEDLAAAVWAYPRNLGDHHFLHTAVYRLRRILDEAGVDDLVDGIRGFGYRIKPGPAPARVPAPDAPRAIAVFDPSDPDLRLSMVNDAAVQLTGYNVATLTNLRQAVADLWAPAEREMIDAAVRETLESGSAQAPGRELTRADGTVVLVDIVLSRLDLPGRGPLCLVEVNPLS